VETVVVVASHDATSVCRARDGKFIENGLVLEHFT
jgi:hypothetical protein